MELTTIDDNTRLVKISSATEGHPADIDSIQLVVYTLSRLADDYLSQAHALDVARSPANVSQYNLLLYASIKIYTSILSNNLNLPATTEISLYLRLAEIYHQETDNYEIMENYLNKAITILKRTNNLDLQFRAEFLQALILINGNHKIGLKYLNLKIENFKELQLFHWIKLFEFLKILLLINNDVKLSLNLLNNFNINNTGENQFEIYCLLIHANLHLSLNHLKDCRAILNTLETCFAKGNIDSTNKHFYSMFKLIDLKYNIELKNYHKSKLLINEFNKFIELNFSTWNSTFSILIPLPINLNKLSNFSFQIKWFSIEELQIILWLLCGIFNLYNYHKLNKPYKYLQMSLRMLDAYNSKILLPKNHKTSLIDKSGISMNDLNLKIFKLKYLRFQILYYLSYYELLTENLNFANSKLMNLQELLHELPPHYRSILKFPFLKNVYLSALIHQNEGKLLSAKNLYMKILNTQYLTDDQPVYNSDSAPVITYNFPSLFYLNINKLSAVQNNQLFIYSSLNLLLIYLQELKTSADSKIIESLTIQRNEVLNNLKSLIIDCDDELLQKTVDLVLSLFKNSNDEKSNDTSDYSVLSDKNIDPHKMLLETSGLLNESANGSITMETMDILLYDILYKLIHQRNQATTIMTKQQSLLECFKNSKLSKNLAIRYFTSYQLCEIFKNLDDPQNMDIQFEKTIKLERDLNSMLSESDMYV